jgi:hypothetical protein
MKVTRFTKTNKYHNNKVEYDGILFDSRKERDAYVYLRALADKGIISNLVLQPKWELTPAIKEKYIKHLKTKDKECERTVQLPITYTADFQCECNGETHVFDVKISPKMLPVEYRIKVKLMRYFHGIKVIEIYKISDFDKYLKHGTENL